MANHTFGQRQIPVGGGEGEGSGGRRELRGEEGWGGCVILVAERSIPNSHTLTLLTHAIPTLFTPSHPPTIHTLQVSFSHSHSSRTPSPSHSHPHHSPDSHLAGPIHTPAPSPTHTLLFFYTPRIHTLWVRRAPHRER